MSGRLIKVDRSFVNRVKQDKFARAYASVRNFNQLENLIVREGVPGAEDQFLEMPILCSCGLSRSLREAFSSDRNVMVCEACGELYWDQEFCIALRALMRAGWETAFEAILSKQDWLLIYPMPRSDL